MPYFPHTFDPSQGRHRDHDEFMKGLQERRRVMISFFSKSGDEHELRECAPVDFGPSSRVKDPANRYHFFDYTGRPGPHPMSLTAEQIYRMRASDRAFDPKELREKYPEPKRWWTPRDWGTDGDGWDQPQTTEGMGAKKP